MVDNWIDGYAGEETTPRAEFQAELRAALARELKTASPRRQRQKASAWAAAAAGILAVGVLVTDDAPGSISPAAVSTGPSDSAATTYSTMVFDDGLRQVLIDRQWTLVSADGEPSTIGATFTLNGDGTLVGFDGCNRYSTDASLPGWRLDGNILRIDQQLVGTAVSCSANLQPIVPVVDGSELHYSISGLLSITGARSFMASMGAAPPDPALIDLAVPAAGGVEFAPTVLATLPDLTATQSGSASPLVAMLQNEIVVLQKNQEGTGLTGEANIYDRAGSYLRTTRMRGKIPTLPFWVGGDNLDTVYMVFRSPDNSWSVTASKLGDVGFTDPGYGATGGGGDTFETGRFRAVPGKVSTEDGVGFSFTEKERAPGPEVSLNPRAVGTIATVERTEIDGTRRRWVVSTSFHPGAPPKESILALPFAGGVLLEGATSSNGDRFLALLHPTGGNVYFRLGEWRFVGADNEQALFARDVDGSLQLGVIAGNPTV